MKYKDYIYIGVMTLFIFTGSYAILALLGFVPEQFKFTKAPEVVDNEPIFNNPSDSTDVEEEAPDTNTVPQKIEIAKIGVSSNIYIPSGVDVASLDSALTRGAVYYPGSGTLQGGNMFLFGHSTNWKVVNNAAYKTFNGLEKLIAGDEIKLTSNGETYVYAVRSVKLADENDALVQFASDGRMLTISTCDTFGQKDDRWVVVAEFVRMA